MAASPAEPEGSGAAEAEEALVERAEGGSRTLVRAGWLPRLPGGRPPTLEELLALPHRALLSEPTRLLRVVPLEGGRALFVKVYLFSPVTGVGSLFGRTIAEREYEGLRLFERAGLPVAPPAGWAVERRAGIVRAAAVLEEALPDSIDLQAWAARLGPRAKDPKDEERNAALDALGALFRRAHDAGVACGPKGAHIRNVLLVPPSPAHPERSGRAAAAESNGLVFVDLPNARRASGVRLEAERARDLGRLVIRLAGAYGGEGRDRFLAAYHAGDPPEARAALAEAVEEQRRIAADETGAAAMRKSVRRMFRKLMGLRGKRRPGTLPGGT